MTLNELFEDRYLPLIRRNLKPKTVAEYERLARTAILPMLGAREIEEITMDVAEGMHVFVPGKVQANRALALLSAILGYAVERRLLAHNPCRGVHRNKEKPREFFYTAEQTRALLAAAASSDDIRHKYIAVELLTGCRPGELLEASPDWRHGAVLRTPDGKTGARNIYLPPAACAILDALTLSEWADGSIRYFPEGMSLRRAWGRLCKAAGVPRARLYDLRHTFASAALASKQSLAVVGQLLGHRKAQTTLRYTHLAPDVGLDAAAAAAARMGATK
jgi:integrase